MKKSERCFYAGKILKFLNNSEIKVKLLKRVTPKSNYFHFPNIDISVVILREPRKLPNPIVTGGNVLLLK